MPTDTPRSIGPILEDPSGGQVDRENIARIEALAEGEVAQRNMDDPRKWGRELAAQFEVEALLDDVAPASDPEPIVVPRVNFTTAIRRT